MAQVDFSNAVLEPYTDVKALSLDQNLGIEKCGYVVDSSMNSIVSSFNASALVNTPTRKINVYNGTFSDSGTECYLRYYFSIAYNAVYWKISNISFSSGDTFSFAIEVDVNGNS